MHNGHMSEPIIRTLRKSDYPALIDVVRRMWYPEYDEKTGLLAAETDWENCLARDLRVYRGTRRGTSRVDSGASRRVGPSQAVEHSSHQFLARSAAIGVR